VVKRKITAKVAVIFLEMVDLKGFSSRLRNVPPARFSRLACCWRAVKPELVSHAQ